MWHRSERGMKERDPVELQWDKAGVGPVDRVVGGPDVGEEPDPSQEPVLDGTGMDHQELGRSSLDRDPGSRGRET